MNSETLVISVWLVDPVGGEPVAWPRQSDEADDAYIGSRSILETALRSKRMSEQCPFLAKVVSRLPEAWIAHGQLGLIEDELHTAIELASKVAPQDNVSEELIASFEKIRNACQFALCHESAGVYIG